MTKAASDRGYGFTPGGWKFLAVAFAFLVVHNNLADADSVFRWVVFGMSTTCAVLLLFAGHRPSPRKLWRDKPGATAQVVEKEGPCGHRVDLANAGDSRSDWYACVLARGHDDFHSDGRGNEWLGLSQQEGEDR